MQFKEDNEVNRICKGQVLILELLVYLVA